MTKRRRTLSRRARISTSLPSLSLLALPPLSPMQPLMLLTFPRHSSATQYDEFLSPPPLQPDALSHAPFVLSIHFRLPHFAPPWPLGNAVGEDEWGLGNWSLRRDGRAVGNCRGTSSTVQRALSSLHASQFFPSSKAALTRERDHTRLPPQPYTTHCLSPESTTVVWNPIPHFGSLMGD